jgi:hypothetical protein
MAETAKPAQQSATQAADGVGFHCLCRSAPKPLPHASDGKKTFCGGRIGLGAWSASPLTFLECHQAATLKSFAGATHGIIKAGTERLRNLC